MPYVTVTCVARIFGKCASRIFLEPEMESGMIGQPVFVAILNEPLWNSPSSSSLGVLPRVPSGKIQMEVPLLISSHPAKDHLQTLFDVGAVEKQAVDEIHPVL